ncbi:MAG TPA: TRAP transporter large permease subunit [Telmatospirillum sp.]|nr:TRAP transporter large permease subunit [Telmatospirillum sp.]
MSVSSDGVATPLVYDGSRLVSGILNTIEHISGLLLGVDVIVVFLSVIFRYFLHMPFDWAEEIAAGLMTAMVFLGAATVVGRSGHVGIDLFVVLLPKRARSFVGAIAAWITTIVAVVLVYAISDLLLETVGETTPTGLPQWAFLMPVLVGGVAIVGFALLNVWKSDPVDRWSGLLVCLVLTIAIFAWNEVLPDSCPSPLFLLVGGAVISLMLGVPIAFALAFGAMLYFLIDPSLGMQIWAQQLASGANHFVLLSIPFFVLAGLTMEANGMSSRLIELLLRMIGPLRGGLNLIVILATVFFSGVSGSKLADIAAVGGVIMPAVRRTGQDENETAGLLACTAVMAETIPPCVNLIIFAFVSNISIGGLFVAGLVPAGLMALALIVVAVYAGSRIDIEKVFVEQKRRPLLPLIGGAGLTLAMILMIGRGVTTGIATSTEISAFAVVYAFLVGGLVFRELSWRAMVELFVRSASMTGAILFIIATASSLSFAVTVERIPDQLSAVLVGAGHSYGAVSFVLISVGIMFFFGMILEGAPSMILFGPLLTPIAVKLGVNPLQFGTVAVIAMGMGFFSPPMGVGIFATSVMTGTQVKKIVRPMMKYLAVLVIALLALVLVPEFSLWLPRHFGMSN